MYIRISSRHAISITVSYDVATPITTQLLKTAIYVKRVLISEQHRRSWRDINLAQGYITTYDQA